MTGQLVAESMSATTGRPLSAATVSGYAADWALFIDWCHATGYQPLPADAATIDAFRAGCPAVPATIRRRRAAIDHHHRVAGHQPPSLTDRDPSPSATGRRARETLDPARMVCALQVVPSHGWTAGLFGRRDRALLVFAGMTDIPYRQLAAMSAGQIRIKDGVAEITDGNGTVSIIKSGEDPVLCGPCALARWLRVLDLFNRHVGRRRIAKLLDDAKTVTASSRHQCMKPKPIDAVTVAVPLFPPVNQWGHLPLPIQALTPHSVSSVARQADTGLALHRALPVDEVVAEVAIPAAPIPLAASRAPYDWAAANRRKIDAIRSLEPLSATLDDLEARVEELLARARRIEQT